MAPVVTLYSPLDILHTTPAGGFCSGIEINMICKLHLFQYLYLTPPTPYPMAPVVTLYSPLDILHKTPAGGICSGIEINLICKLHLFHYLYFNI